MYIHVGTKLTKKVDIGSAIFNAIKDDNSRVANGPLLDACKVLGMMRGEVTNISYLDASLASTEGQRTLLEYYRALTAVAPRLPPNCELQSELTWYDAFDRDQCISQRHIHYERMAVLFNMAASQAAAAQSIQRSDTTEDLKKVLHLFQTAAGYFNVIIDTPLSGSLSVDMYPESLKILKAAMLVNAQAAFAQVAARNNVSHNVQARLAAGARDLCNEIVRRSRAQGVAGSQLDQQLCKSAEALSLYYDAEAHSHRAHVCGEEHVMDERLTRLGNALSIISMCRTKFQALPKSSDVNGFRDIMLNKLAGREKNLLSRQKTAQEENNSFHFVTPLETVPPITGHLSAKAVDVSESLRVRDEDQLVAKLAAAVPPQAKGVAARYAAAAYDLVNAETGKLKSASSNLRDKVTQVEATLSTSETMLNKKKARGSGSDQGPENRVSFVVGMEALRQLQREGGLEYLRSLEDAVKAQSARTRELLRQVQNTLSAEEAEDDRIRHVSLGRINRAQSRELNGKYHTKIHQILNAFENAARADSFVANQIQEHAAAILRASRADIEEGASRQTNGGTRGDHRGVASGEDLRTHLRASKALLDESKEILNELEIKAAQDPTEFLGQNDASKSLSKEEEVQKCRDAIHENFKLLTEKAENCCQRSGQMCETLTDALEAYRDRFADQANSDTSKADLYAHFPAAAKYREILDYIKQGSEYYRKEEEVIEQLQRDVSSFVSSRRGDVSSQFGGLNLGGHNVPSGADSNYSRNFPPGR